MAEFPCLFSSRRPTRLISVLVACGFLMTVANASANTFLRVSIGNLVCGVLAGVIGIGDYRGITVTGAKTPKLNGRQLQQDEFVPASDRYDGDYGATCINSQTEPTAAIKKRSRE